jgi:hypothetical protein
MAPWEAERVVMLGMCLEECRDEREPKGVAILNGDPHFSTPMCPGILTLTFRVALARGRGG